VTGTHSIQTGGVNVFELFAKKGRDEWDEVEKLIPNSWALACFYKA